MRALVGNRARMTVHATRSARECQPHAYRVVVVVVIVVVQHDRDARSVRLGAARGAAPSEALNILT